MTHARSRDRRRADRDRGAPGSRAGRRRGPDPGARGRHQRRRPACSARATTRRRRAHRPTSPASSAPARRDNGERVMALLPGGGQAELVAVHESHVLPVPDDVGWPQAGGFMEVFATAHDARLHAGRAAARRAPARERRGGRRRRGRGSAGRPGGRDGDRHRTPPPRRDPCARRRGHRAGRRLRRDPRARRRREPGDEPGAARAERADRRDRRGCGCSGERRTSAT